MKIDVSNWKRFQLQRLFDIKKGKRLTAEDQEEGNNIYIGAIDSNNGVANYIGQNPIHEGNTISLSYNGSVGEAFYQPEPYWATDDVNALYPRFDGFNQYIGLFLVAVLRQEKYRFSYGRKWKLENMKVTEICLPVLHDDSGSIVVDKTHKFSDDGYVPDWQFMEDYIKSLHYKTLTTQNKDSNVPALNVQDWKEFPILQLFNKVEIAKSADIGNLEDGTIPFIGRTDIDNGVQGFVSPKHITKGSCITISMVGTNVALYQENDFQASQNIAILRRNGMTKAISLFICSLINFEMKLKYSYGRTVGKTNIEQMILHLPVDSAGNPDWQFMEDFMKALPYGDRLNG